MMLADETIDESKPLKVFHPVYTWKTKIFYNYYTKDLLEPLFIDGKLVANRYKVKEIKDYAQKEKDSFWPQYLRISSPERYKVDLSEKLWELKNELIEMRKKDQQ